MPVIDLRNREINAALGDPKIKAKLIDLGGTELAVSAAEFAQMIVEETKKWSKVVQFSMAKP